MKIAVFVYSISLTLFLSPEPNAKHPYPASFDFENSLIRLKETKYLEQCGIDSAYVCLRYFGRDISLFDIASKVPSETVDRGMSITEFQRLLNLDLLHSILISGRPEIIDPWLKQHCVVIIPNMVDDHLYVYLGRQGEEYLRYNPPYSNSWVSRDVLLRDWEGHAVVVSDKKIANKTRYRVMTWIGTLFPRKVLISASIGLAILGVWLRRRGGEAMSRMK